MCLFLDGILIILNDIFYQCSLKKGEAYKSYLIKPVMVLKYFSALVDPYFFKFKTKITL